MAELAPLCRRESKACSQGIVGSEKERARRVKEGKPTGSGTPPGWGGPGGELKRTCELFNVGIAFITHISLLLLRKSLPEEVRLSNINERELNCFF